MASRLLFCHIMLLLLTVVTANPFAPVLTPAARLPRADDDDVELQDDTIGYYWYTSGSKPLLATASCAPGYIFATSNTWANCCRTTSRSSSGWNCDDYIVTNCDGYTAYYANGRSIACDYYCNGDAIYPGSTAGGAWIQFLGCNTVSEQISYFQEKPTETSATTTSSSSDSSSSQDSSRRPPATPTAPTNEPEQTASTNFLEPVPEKDSSKAWIAGVVVGVVAFLAILAIIIWFLHRRKRNKAQPYQPAPQTTQAYPPAYPDGYASPPPNAFSPGLSPNQDPAASTQDRQSWKPQSGANGYDSPSLQPQPHPAAAGDMPELASVTR